MKIQVTLYHKEGKYKPMSTLVEVESIEYYEGHKKEVQHKALLNIGHQRHLTPSEIVKNGYTKVRAREYDLEKIQAQQEHLHKVNLIKYIERKRKENRENSLT